MMKYIKIQEILRFDCLKILRSFFLEYYIIKLEYYNLILRESAL